MHATKCTILSVLCTKICNHTQEYSTWAQLLLLRWSSYTKISSHSTISDTIFLCPLIQFTFKGKFAHAKKRYYAILNLRKCGVNQR